MKVEEHFRGEGRTYEKRTKEKRKNIERNIDLSGKGIQSRRPSFIEKTERMF
jgi:hypothetical protein